MRYPSRQRPDASMTGRIPTLALFCLIGVVTSGCLGGKAVLWQPPIIPPTVATIDGGAEELLAAAALADQAGDEAASDLYFAAARVAWRTMSAEPRTEVSPSSRLEQTYRIAIARWLETARNNGRWIPGEGIQVQTETGTLWVPICPVGFAWHPGEFEELHAVGDYHSPSLSRCHFRAGLGTPVVVRRCASSVSRRGDRFLPPHISFSATAILRLPDASGSSPPEAVLELWNPLSNQMVVGPAGPAPLAADTSAVFAFREQSLNLVPSPFEMFVHPDNNPAFEGLYFLEPYQPGKIPVVFVHGLMSSPRTWIDMANDLRAIPDFNARYQIWAFDYATGKSFVRAAAELRRALCEAHSELAQCGDDPALNEIVLIGHSMGGLVSKLQVTSSGDHLWNSIAREPFDEVQMSESIRRPTREVYFFEPLPQVRRVIFVGTPHRGAALAARLAGRTGSALVRRSPEERTIHHELVADNPGVFRRSVRWRLPTSIDMLEPRNAVARAIDELPLSCDVGLHTIAGSGYFTVGLATGDGVVPLSSARHAASESELLVNATHTQIHRTSEAVAEIWRILDEHSR